MESFLRYIDPQKPKWKPVGGFLQERITAKKRRENQKARDRAAKEAATSVEAEPSPIHPTSIQKSTPRIMKQRQMGKEMADPKRWTQIDTAARGAHLKPTYSPGSEAAASDPNYNPDAR